MTVHQSSLAVPGELESTLESARTSARRTDRFGWLSVGLLTIAVAVTWAPMLNAAFGDNHEGRVLARYALHMRNLHEKGLLGSHFSADWEPFWSVYAHHPPLPNILHAIFSALPGNGEYQIRLAPYLLGLCAIPAAAALLRAFRIRWVPILLALGLMAVTGFYWFYGRLVHDLGPLLIMSAAIAVLRPRKHPPVWLVGVAGAASLLGTLASWGGIAAAAVLGLWLLTGRGVDRATVAVGLSMTIGVAVSLAFVVAVSGLHGLLAQGELRTSGGDFTMREFIGRQWLWLRNLLPSWYLALLPVGVLAGLLNRRTRFYTAFSAALACGWVLALPNGSYIHDYWPYPVLVPGVVGMAALCDWVWEHAPRSATSLAAAAAAGLLTVAFVHLVTGPQAAAYFSQPTRAGELVREHRPPKEQESAWYVNLSPVRWLAYYWDLHQVPVTGQIARSADPGDLVVVRLDRLPAWTPAGTADRTVARNGRYALVRMGDLRPADDLGFGR
jgi:hypothetical protein